MILYACILKKVHVVGRSYVIGYCVSCVNLTEDSQNIRHRRRYVTHIYTCTSIPWVVHQALTCTQRRKTTHSGAGSFLRQSGAGSFFSRRVVFFLLWVQVSPGTC
jgi:hypothetical protein